MTRAPNLTPYFLIAASFFPLAASAQACRGNPDVGCTSPGAQCSSANVPKGYCSTPSGFPKGERQCLCEALPSTPPPPVVLHPKYVIGALIYAPPGCNSRTPGAACSQPGLVDYSSSSSMGTKVNIAQSFKYGLKATLSTGSPVTGAQASFEWSSTQGDSNSASLTKTESLEIKDPGNGDGIDHDQDMFELFLNPTLTLSMDTQRNIYWQPGWTTVGPVRLEVYVSELRNPATMRPQVAATLQGLGFTAADYKTIRCMDPFAGPGASGAGGAVPDYCQTPTASAGSSGVGIDTNRFRPTTWILPYEAPQKATDLCPSTAPTIKNDYANENATSTQDTYTVTTDVSAGVPAFGLKLEGSLSWTTGATYTTTQGSTQSASLTLVCPSVSFNGPPDVWVWVDQIFGTFVFVPYNPVTMQIAQQGTVTGSNGKPALGESVTLKYGGHTYHTFTSARGAYRFIRLKAGGTQKGVLTVHGQTQNVTVGSQKASAIRLH